MTPTTLFILNYISNSLPQDFVNRICDSQHSNTSGLFANLFDGRVLKQVQPIYQAASPILCSVCWRSTPTISFSLQVCSFVHQNKLSRMRSIIRLSDLLPPRAHLMMLRRIERHSFLPNLGQRVGIGPTYFFKRELQAGLALLSLLPVVAGTWLCNSLCSKRRCPSLPSCHDWRNVPPYHHGIRHLLCCSVHCNIIAV